MKILYKLCIPLFLFILGNKAAGQPTGHEIKVLNKDNKIALNDILGDWYTIDSAAYKISFINVNNYFVHIDGIDHGVGGNYIFRMEGDSISVNGSAPNWPPYDCTLWLFNDNHLEIEFYQFYSTVTTRTIYRRRIDK